MHTITWKPGTNPEMDELYDILRDQQYRDTGHRLHNNYSKNSFTHAGIIAYTICFNDNNDPEMCSSISSRDCWPKGVYRILNRLWKHSNKIAFPRVMSTSFGNSTQSQINWLKENTDYQLYFISRQTNNWENWCIKHFYDDFNLEFKTDNYRYLTCPNQDDDTCWQKIIYNGDESLLLQWNRH